MNFLFLWINEPKIARETFFHEGHLKCVFIGITVEENKIYLYSRLLSADERKRKINNGIQRTVTVIDCKNFKMVGILWNEYTFI